MILRVAGDINQYNRLQQSVDVCDIDCAPLSNDVRMFALRFGFLKVVCLNVKTSICANKV